MYYAKWNNEIGQSEKTHTIWFQAHVEFEKQNKWFGGGGEVNQETDS